jgi:hypothetical protein
MSYALKGLCGEFLTDMDGNEYFPQGGTGLYPPDYANNWPAGVPKGISNPSAVWMDKVGIKDCIFAANGCYPDSQTPRSPRLTTCAQRTSPLQIENDYVRVLDVTDTPHRLGKMHEHKVNRVMIYRTKCNIRITGADGKIDDRH